MDVRVGLWRKLSTEELMLLNCGVGTPESPLDCKEIQPVHSEDQPWDFFGRNDAKAETPVLWPPHAKSWLIGKDSCWEELGAGGEGDDRGWDGWMASLTRWTWIWVNSGSWWWTGRPGVLRFMGSQRVGHNWATELNWTYILLISIWRNRKWPLVLKPLLQKLIIYRNRVWYWTFSLTVSFGNMYQMYQSFSL